MIPELGNYCLVLALCLALLLGTLPLAGAARGNPRWMALAAPAAAGQFMFVALAFGCLAWSFAANDFSVRYVANNANSLLPLYYRVAATWGGHEGSLLLWTLMLAGWTLAVAVFSRSLPDPMRARALGVLGLVAVGFLLFMLLTSNPFTRLAEPPDDGRDLNPLLQDLGMIIHPPLLYMGYVGFSVAFALAIAALLGNQLDTLWARWSRPWTLAAWAFLTLGIFMGSYWAYYELGWGGWWFWDAVENASFMPWLVGTALLHSLAVTEQRGGFRNWTVLLAILAFSLSLLGTFLVRSGVLSSVHAFATDPERGLFILVFLALVVGGSLTLYTWRAPGVAPGEPFALVSRETLLLLNNVLLLAAAGTVLLGTMYPLFLDALGLGKLSVGPPYFETVFVPLMLPLLVLLGIGPFLRWKQAGWREALAQLRVPAAGAVVALVAAAAAGAAPLVAVGLGVAAWVLLASGAHLVRRLRHGGRGQMAAQAARSPRSYWGMLLGHAGMGVFVIGVTMARGYDESRDASLRVGQAVEAGGYQFVLAAVGEVRGPNYVGMRATVQVRRDGRPVATMHPERRLYTVQDMTMTEAAIDRGLARDLYVSLGEETGDGRWVVRAQHKPFIGWIWGGCLLMAAGGALSASDRRYRLARAASRRQAAAPAPLAGSEAR